MPRYHYHIRTRTGLYPDRKGRDCPDLGEAVQQAYLCAIDRWRNAGIHEPVLEAVIDVSDSAGANVFSLPVAAVVTRIGSLEAA